MKKSLDATRDQSKSFISGSNGKHLEMMKFPNSNNNETEDNDDFISSESDRQSLLIKLDSTLSLTFYFLPK